MTVEQKTELNLLDIKISKLVQQARVFKSAYAHGSSKAKQKAEFEAMKIENRIHSLETQKFKIIGFPTIETQLSQALRK